MMRKGLGRGTGKGYKNIVGKDPKVHSDSARGRKQPQKIPKTRFLTKKSKREYTIGSFHASSHPSPPNDDIAKRHSECARGIKTAQKIKLSKYYKIFDPSRAKRNKILYGEVRDNLISKRWKEYPDVSAVSIFKKADKDLKEFEKETESAKYDLMTGRLRKNPVILLRQDSNFQKFMKEAGVK